MHSDNRIRSKVTLNGAIPLDSLALFEKPRALCERACIAAALANQDLQERAGSEGEAIARVLCDFDLHVDRRDESVARHLLVSGFWEWWISKAIADATRPGMVCIDIGANAGYFTLLMVGLRASRVLAFEPIPHLAKMLERSKETNGWDHVTVHQLALTNQKGKANLCIPSPDNLGGASIMAHNGETILESIPTTTLDEMVQDLPRVDMVKIDAEGAEPLIWEGMEQTLRNNPKIQIFAELTVNNMAGPWLEKIRRDGFRIGFVEYDGTVRPFQEELLSDRLLWMLHLTR